MKKTFNLITLFAITLMSSLQSCKKPSIDAEENELITTIKLNFTESGTRKTFTWKDTDGEGGKNPVIENITLKPLTTYTVSIEFLDESKSPATDITNEVAKESDEHLVVYTVSPSGFASYTYSDKDAMGFPIGLNGIFKTNAAGKGALKVQLRHQPAINGKATKDGNSIAGSDDVNVDFNLVVE